MTILMIFPNVQMTFDRYFLNFRLVWRALTRVVVAVIGRSWYFSCKILKRLSFSFMLSLHFSVLSKEDEFIHFGSLKQPWQNPLLATDSLKKRSFDKGPATAEKNVCRCQNGLCPLCPFSPVCQHWGIAAGLHHRVVQWWNWQAFPEVCDFTKDLRGA